MYSSLQKKNNWTWKRKDQDKNVLKRLIGIIYSQTWWTIYRVLQKAAIPGDIIMESYLVQSLLSDQIPLCARVSFICTNSYQYLHKM